MMVAKMKGFTVIWLCMVSLGVFAFVGLPVCALAQDGGAFASVGSATSSSGNGWISSHGGFSATTTGTPSVGSGLSVSSSNGTAEASMIGVLQQGNSNGITAMSQYSEYVKASGAINNFDVGFHYQSASPTSQSPEPWYGILSSPATFGGSGMSAPFFPADSGSSAPAPWHTLW